MQLQLAAHLLYCMPLFGTENSTLCWISMCTCFSTPITFSTVHLAHVIEHQNYKPWKSTPIQHVGCAICLQNSTCSVLNHCLAHCGANIAHAQGLKQHTSFLCVGACPSIPGVLSITLPSQDQPRMTRRIATCLSKYPGSTKYHATIPGSTQDDQAYSHMLVQVSREY